MKWFKQARMQKLRNILSSEIHEAFTKLADKLYKLGYMNEKQRIRLSNIIGNTLDNFKKEFNTQLKELIDTEVDEKKILKIIEEKEEEESE